MRCWLWTLWLWHIAQLSVTPRHLFLSGLPLREGATILESPVFGACCSLSHPCVLWWETAPLWAVTNALSPSSPARQYLTLNPNAPTQIIFVQFSKKRPKSPLAHICNNQDCITDKNIMTRWMCRTGGYPSLNCPHTVLSPCLCSDATSGPAPATPLQYNTPAFLSVSLALWRLDRQIPRSSLLIYQCKQNGGAHEHNFQAFDLTPP